MIAERNACRELREKSIAFLSFFSKSEYNLMIGEEMLEKKKNIWMSWRNDYNNNDNNNNTSTANNNLPKKKLVPVFESDA